MSASVKLQPNLDLAAAGPLWSELSKLRSEDVELDASEVDRFGGLCAQVLLCAIQAWGESQKNLSICAPSPAFCDAAERMGMSEMFGLNGCVE